MPRRGLTKEWSIELDESFRGRVVDEDLQFVSVGPPVRIAGYSTFLRVQPCRVR
jgi:hypothetical protein